MPLGQLSSVSAELSFTIITSSPRVGWSNGHIGLFWFPDDTLEGLEDQERVVTNLVHHPPEIVRQSH